MPASPDGQGALTAESRQKALEAFASVGGRFALVRVGQKLDVLQTDRCLRPSAALPNYVRHGHIVCHAIDPGAQGAKTVEASETSPQGDVDVLKQVPADFRVGFVRARQTLQRRTKARYGFPVEIVL